MASLFCIMLSMNLLSQGTEQKNIVGFGVGYVPPKMAYINAPPYIWADIKASPVYEIFYARQFQEGRLGSYFEYQSASFKAVDVKVSSITLA
jgi:hypothetical protein